MSHHPLKAAPGPTSRYFTTRLQSVFWWKCLDYTGSWLAHGFFILHLLGMGEIIEVSALEQWETFGLQKDTFFFNKYDVIRNPTEWEVVSQSWAVCASVSQGEWRTHMPRRYHWRFRSMWIPHLGPPCGFHL